MNKYAVAVVASLALTAVAHGAAAQDAAAGKDTPSTAWYVGIGLGITDASIPQQTVDSFSSFLTTGLGATFSDVDEDDSSTGAKLFVGYTVNRNLAIELGYVALGDSKATITLLGGPASLDTFDLNYKMTATFIDAVGMLPLNEQWTLLGRVGVNYGWTSSNVGGSEGETREKFGAGIGYNLNKKFTVRAEWERYKMADPLSDDTFNADLAALSVLCRF